MSDKLQIAKVALKAIANYTPDIANLRKKQDKISLKINECLNCQMIINDKYNPSTLCVKHYVELAKINRDIQRCWDNQHIDIKRIAREALAEMEDDNHMQYIAEIERKL